MNIAFCTQCGGPVSFLFSAGDSRNRHTCTQCGFIHYQNPKIVAGCLVYKGDQVLLCKRSIEPRASLWTLPAGFMETGETTRQAAERETLEESAAIVACKQLYVVANSPKAGHVNMIYLADLIEITSLPTPESSEVRFFGKDDAPWERIAFYTVRLVLECFFEDTAKGEFMLREIDF